jgi:hypothetical protein
MAFYRKFILPISLSDCIDACIYLTETEKNEISFVDLGLSYVYDTANMWSGNCDAVQYTNDGRCVLLAKCDNSSEINMQPVSVWGCWVFIAFVNDVLTLLLNYE